MKNNNPTILRTNFFKKIFLAFILIQFFSLNAAKAQVNVNVNIGSQALWGPTGYDYVDYYYLPEADVYYYVPTAQFIYLNGDQWIFESSLPMSYHVDLFSTYVVVVNSPKPYLQHNIYFTKYGKFKHRGRNYIPIRDSDDERYFIVKGHPKHGEGNGNGGGKKYNDNTSSGRSGNQERHNSGGGNKSNDGGGNQEGRKSGGGNKSSGGDGGGGGGGKHGKH